MGARRRIHPVVDHGTHPLTPSTWLTPIPPRQVKRSGRTLACGLAETHSVIPPPLAFAGMDPRLTKTTARCGLKRSGGDGLRQNELCECCVFAPRAGFRTRKPTDDVARVKETQCWCGFQRKTLVRMLCKDPAPSSRIEETLRGNQGSLAG